MISVELLKLVRRPRTWVAIGLLCMLPVVVAIFVATSHLAPPPGKGPAFLSAVLNNGSLYPAAGMAMVMPLFLPIAVTVLAGDSVAGEASGGTLRYLLVRPVGRTRLLVAKLLTVIVFVLLAIGAVVGTSYLAGTMLLGNAPPAAVGEAGGVTSLSGAPLTAQELALRVLATVGFVTVSMIGLAAFALFLSTLTDSSLGAALGALSVMITSDVLVTLDAAKVVQPYLPTRYWLAWIDFYRDPVFWRDIERGLLLQAVYLVLLLGASWANFMTKDIKS
jgi:ABC-2 type transport system permease protein